MKNKLKQLLLLLPMLLMVGGIFLSPGIQSVQPAFALDAQTEFTKVIGKSGLTTTGAKVPSLGDAVGIMINGILGLIGLVTFVLIIYAGALWVTAAGNEDQVTKAKGMLRGAVIGILVIFSAFIVVNFTLDALTGATQGEVVEAPTTTPPPSTTGGN